MTFNQGSFLEYIESIVGVLSFSIEKRVKKGKNYVSTFNCDVSSIYFLSY